MKSYFENELKEFKVAKSEGDFIEAHLHMGRMQGFIMAMYNVDFDYACRLQDELQREV